MCKLLENVCRTNGFHKKFGWIFLFLKSMIKTMYYRNIVIKVHGMMKKIRQGWKFTPTPLHLYVFLKFFRMVDR